MIPVIILQAVSIEEKKVSEKVSEKINADKENRGKFSVEGKNREQNYLKLKK